MTGDGIPPPRDEDDGDVAWALTTAQVQWSRGAFADAVVWLRRGVDAAVEVGDHARASDLRQSAARLSEQMLSEATRRSSPDASLQPPAASEVDDLLDSIPPPPVVQRSSTASIDVELDLGGDSTLLTDYAHDSVAAARAEADAADAAARAVSVKPPRVPPPPPRARASSPALPGNPFLDHAVLSADIESMDESAEPVLSADLFALPSEAPVSGEPVNSSDLISPGAEPDAPLTVGVESGDLQSDALGSDEVTPPRAVPVTLPTEAAPSPAAAPTEATELARAMVGTIALEDVPGLQDLPPEAQALLAASARIEAIDLEEEAGNFEVALIIDGWVSLMPAIDDVVAAAVHPGGVVFTTGTLEQGVALRVVAGEDATHVAVWDRAAFQAAVADCPWVADDLRLVADRHQALAGATMGPLGERLDESLRSMVFDRLSVRALAPGEVLVQAGKTLRGMHIVGGGVVEIVEAEGDAPTGDFGLGEVVFAERVLDHGPVRATARAGSAGALVLVGDPMATAELLTSVPPLLEILAS